MPEGLGTVGKYTTQETSHKLKKTRRKKDAIYRSNNESQCLIGWLDLNTAMLEKNKQQPCTNSMSTVQILPVPALGPTVTGTCGRFPATPAILFSVDS